MGLNRPKYTSGYVLARNRVAITVRAINRFMKPAIKEFKLFLSSHSFRINYITRLLRMVPIQRVRKIVGHQDIKTTDRCDRCIISREEIGEVVDVALEDKGTN